MADRSAAAEQDRPWLRHYPEHVPDSIDYPQRPLGWLLERAAHDFPDRVAYHYYNEQMTYAALGDQARRAASLFSELGLRPGDRVGLLLPNVPEYLIAAYGTWMAGGTVVSLNPLMVADDVSSLIEATDCRIVVSLDMLTPLITIRGRRPLPLLVTTLQNRLPHFKRIAYGLFRWRRVGIHPERSDPAFQWLSDALARQPSTLNSPPSTLSPQPSTPNPQPSTPNPDPPTDNPAYILPTGGTTGNPKAVVLSHGNLIANAWQLLHWTDNRIGSESLLAVVPFFHSYGLTTCATTGVAAATTIILHHRFQAKHVLRLIERYRPTCFPAVPAMLVALNELLRRRPAQGQLIEYCISGGAPLDPAVGAEFAEHSGAQVVEGYGLSEASPVTHVGPLDGSDRRGTIGLPLPDTDARIADAETGTQDVEVGQVGELLVRGPQVMTGYLERPAETREAIRDGWLHTGDLASRDEDGFFRIVDRKKDLIITSGYNVVPAEVESVLRQMPLVEDAAVVGVPDPVKGEIVKAILVLKKNARFNRSTFDQWVREKLAKHKRPRLVEIRGGDLPRNFLGKVLRRKLREPQDPHQATFRKNEPTTR